jgi:hypothetical protein
MKKLMGGRVRAGGGESAIDLAERVRRDRNRARRFNGGDLKYKPYAERVKGNK